MQLDVIDVKKFIKDKNDNSTLFVLKGIDIETCGFSRADLSMVIENKFGRMMEIVPAATKVVSFEEYMCIYEMANSQFKHIYILKNNEYDILFPVNALVPEHVSNALLLHYDEDADSESELIDAEILDEYLNVFSDYIKKDDVYFCSYNVEAFGMTNPKIETVSFGDDASSVSEDIGPRYDYSNVISYPEAKEYMKKYWGYDEYRNLRIYDMDALEHGQKKVVSVSQEKIIGDMISQVENCYNGKPARDIFVTASTGAGKSLMFQLPAIYLAQKYHLLTLVISPLIGLMNDQVTSLMNISYDRARTINSDISPIIKEEILQDVANGDCDILYLSPESLLSRSDIAQLIGNRRIGMIVVDEAHIVTTWGKQFRPDYWFLGDHVRKLRSAQGKAKSDPMSFVVATFTATAIYGGNEDMYTETVNSLHMIDPISYLGYVKRDNISIDVSEVKAKRNKTEYRLDKFEALVKQINNAIMHGQKTLIYFPFVSLIESFYSFCYSEHLEDFVAKYHGRMHADEKKENFNAFHDGTKLIMVATKAFGMGIDIPDIVNVIHFAPTGNVCDYMQEIGRAARDKSIEGHAIYEYMDNDFQHINRLHGLSRIYSSQLVEVQKKIVDLFDDQLMNGNKYMRIKKRNEMLLDTECFSYIFDSTNSDDDDLVNKVKTAMLLIQKDYENRGLAPFRMRPIPVFADAYLVLSPVMQREINKRYTGAVELKSGKDNVCKVDLKKIWSDSYEEKMSFPKFKFLLYSDSDELDFNREYSFHTAMSIDLKMNPEGISLYKKVIKALKDVANISNAENRFFSEAAIANAVHESAGISKIKAESIVKVVLAAMQTYMGNYASNMNRKCMDVREFGENNVVQYHFDSANSSFFKWIDRGLEFIKSESKDGTMYVSNEFNGNRTKEILTILGVLESIGVLSFKSLGGTNSQIYIYISSTKNLRIVKERPEMYKNRLLEMISKRHRDSVKMLTFLFESKFSSEEIWEHLENYFIGILPDEIKEDI